MAIISGLRQIQHWRQIVIRPMHLVTDRASIDIRPCLRQHACIRSGPPGSSSKCSCAWIFRFLRLLRVPSPQVSTCVRLWGSLYFSVSCSHLASRVTILSGTSPRLTRNRPKPSSARTLHLGLSRTAHQHHGKDRASGARGGPYIATERRHYEQALPARTQARRWRTCEKPLQKVLVVW